MTRSLHARFYLWACREWSRELQTDFELLRMVRDPEALHALAILRSLSLNERSELVHALAKRFHREGSIEAGDALTVADERRCASFDKLRRTYFDPGIDLRHLASRAAVRRSVLSAMASLVEISPIRRAEYAGIIDAGGARLRIYLDFGGRSRQVGYRQSADLPDGQINYTSILFYLGLSMQTDYSLIVRGEIDEVAASLRDVCERFWTAARHGFEDSN